MPQSPAPTSLSFGPFRLDALRRTLLKNGQPVYLTPKSFDVLALLVAREGELVNKEEIIAEVWPGVVIEESNLPYHISVVRRALGESASKRGYIVTVPGKGYRFVAPPSDAASPDVQIPHETVALPSAPARLSRKPLWLVLAGVAAIAILALGLTLWLRRTPPPWRQLTFDRADDSQPDVSPDGRYIVFVSNRGGHHNIWRMRPDGSEPLSLTNDQREDDSPSWSPDGQRIAFQSISDNGLTYIYVMNADGSGKHAVSTRTGGRAAWSPDGRSLLFQSRHGQSSAIFRVDLATATETRLTTPEEACFDPAWSPDGQWILHTRSVSHRLGLYLMDAHGERVQPLTNLFSGNASVPAWSPDGTRIAFTGNHGRVSGVFVMRADGREISLLTAGFGEAGEASWSQDGRRIYFDSSRSGNSDIYSVEAPPGSGRRLTQDVGEDNTPMLSPSGDELAFTSNRQGDFDIYVKNLVTGRVENVTHHRADDRNPSWSPDGAEIAFESNRSGRPQIYILRRRDGVVRQVSPGSEDWTQPAWSPDGNTLAAVSGPLGQGRLKLLPLHGGQPTDLAPEITNVGWPAWSSDGTTIAFDSPMNGPHRIYTVSRDGGAARALTDGTHISGHAAWRPDGALAFNCACGTGTQIMLLEPGGTMRPLTAATPRNFFPSFSKDGTRVVFVSDRDGNYELYEIYN
ncbi:MAG TPA: winged helix-turn-helix domain-containing protein [Bryobacteraceae bacterium]|nr:winged helix-turn-helix domain-containing protein [Bryobacteraceae bacterium]